MSHEWTFFWGFSGMVAALEAYVALILYLNRRAAAPRRHDALDDDYDLYPND